MKNRLILKSFQSPGDIVMLSAAVRDLHAAHSGRFQTDVRTSADAIWENNPHLTALDERDPEVTSLDMHYPLVHESNQRPYHFVHGYTQYLEKQLGLPIPVTAFRGDIHLTGSEKLSPPRPQDIELPERFWIMVAGGKYDFTAKWWNPASYQAVVDHFRDRIAFVQCGEEGHWHPPLNGVTNLVGKTTLREFIQLMYHAEGVVCPVTLAMHLAAAVESKSARGYGRPCVVVAGGREPVHWEAYPNHQFISTTGTLDCCQSGGCWKSRCQVVDDGDSKDRRELCENPVQVTEDLRIPRCMDMITPEEVIRRVELYHQGGLHHYLNNNEREDTQMTTTIVSPRSNVVPPEAESKLTAEQQQRVLLQFRHGLGDAIQLTAVLRHLRHYHPDWNVEVAALPGKQTAFVGLCGRSFSFNEKPIPTDRYDQVFDLEWDECATCYADYPSTKVERCLTDVFDLAPIPELCRYEMRPREDAVAKAKRYLQQVCKVYPSEDGRYPVVLIHYQGNTSAEYKDLPHATARMVCEQVIKSGSVPIILDWDNRSPLPDGKRIHNPHVDLDIWGGIGTGDAEVLAALIELSSLMIGVDSGPLHVAGATSTPTIAVWTKHHPLHYFGHADNVTHLVPRKHQELLRGDLEAGNSYFETHYRYRPYDNLDSELSTTVNDQLYDREGGLVYTRNFWIRSNNAAQDLVVVQDIAENDSYRIDELPMPEPVIIDVGAHIGCFSQAIHSRNPLARIFAVECCPENLTALRKNVGGFATVIQGAMTYEKDIALLNAVFPDCVTTGGSCVVSREQLAQASGKTGVGADPKDSATAQYWADSRPLMAVTLEQIIEQHNIDRIDVLKLDCEGSEFSILENSTSLERIDRIVGEYHGKDRFHELVQRKFPDWKLRILKDGELGTFWLENPRCDKAVDTAKLPVPTKRCASHCPRQSAAPWIYLCTPQHTGTHFLRILLELHPKVSFWRCGRTIVEGRPLGEWHKLYLDGAISLRELLRLGVRSEPDLPEWTRQEVAKLGLSLPDKRVEYDLIQKHALRTVPWYPSLPTVVSVRDPLLAIISGLRRKGPEVAEGIVAGVTFLATKRDECFMFCVDQWKQHRERALDLMSYLDLEPTQEIYDYIAKWPSPNSSETHQHLILNASSELAEARRLALEDRQVHPIVEPWAQRLRQAGLQEFYESLGYADLAWFE
ncbi:MAG: FkbM family methyltransferase [Planctomycetales bacterium]|nr:FkbM family methyltransferase [Planctomycetales bacterium]